MHSKAVFAAVCVLLSMFVTLASSTYAPSFVAAQEDDYGAEEPSFSVNGMMRMQGGVFAPLISDKFKPHEQEGRRPGSGTLCDVREGTTNCQPRDHGQKPGSPSIARMTLQLEAQWDINEHIGLHAIVRGVRSLALPADRYARVPQQDLAAWRRQDYDAMGDHAQQWVLDNYYSELDLREFYLDLVPNDRVSMRIGRQQIMWGDVGGYRLLDAVNPENTLWHFGPLEAVEDVRIPLWMWLTTIDIPEIEHSLELLWVPMIDRPRDTVTVPGSFGGAWGVPFPNIPTSFFSPNLVFDYPGRKFKDMRAGFRWKGNLGDSTNYSLVYLYTHQFSPPIPDYGFYGSTPSYPVVPDPLNPMGEVARLDPNMVRNTVDPNITSEIVLRFPRQHIAGFSLEQSVPALASIFRLEAAVEPNRTFAGRTDRPSGEQTPDGRTKLIFRQREMMAINYAVVLQRPTMIRFLNPTQNVLLVAQFFHSFVPQQRMDNFEGEKWVQVPGYNAWQLQRHTFRVVAVARTSYLHGLINVGLTGMYMPNPYAKDSGFYSIDVGFRIGPIYRLNLVVTDFVGKDPYRDIGLYRDRDEIAANFTVLF